MTTHQTLATISRRRLFRWGAVALFGMTVAAGQAQSRLNKEGVSLYWGLVPAAIVSQQHALDELHGGRPAGGGQIYHLVVALYESSGGKRIEQAVVRAQLSEPGIVDSAPKYLPQMIVNEQVSYGQLFGMTGDRGYRFRVWVKLPDRPTEIEFTLSGSAPLSVQRP